jgi:hypothetical protein
VKSLLRSGTHLLRVRYAFIWCSASGTHVFFSEQCWPVKQRSALAVLISQVGLTQLKLMFAEARPARAPRPKRVALIMKDGLKFTCKPTEPAIIQVYSRVES